MARQTVTISDLTASIVTEDQKVRLVIKHHPVLDEEVELDTSVDEVEPMLKSSGQYIYVEAHMPDGEVKTGIVEIPVFDAAFKGDPYQALKDARRATPSKTAPTNGSKRSKEELDAIRTWARANGWPDIKDRGRINTDAQAAYDAAHPE